MITILLGTDTSRLSAAMGMFAVRRRTMLFGYVPICRMLLPESGLHPSKHADIAEQIIETHREDKDVVVATHSEVLLLRVRRHIAFGTLDPAHVCILWVNNDESPLRQINVASNGAVDWWPEGIFAEALEETKAICSAQRVLHEEDR